MSLLLLFPLTVLPLGLASEADIAQARAVTERSAAGPAVETDVAFALPRATAVGSAAETDVALMPFRALARRGGKITVGVRTGSAR